MANRTWLCIAILAVSCLLSVPGVQSADKAPQLMEVMYDSKEDFGLFWTAVNRSKFIQNPDFLELSEGDKTILAVRNNTFMRFAENYGVTLDSVQLPNVTKMLYPLIEYHVVKGVKNFSSLPLKTSTIFETLLAGKKNALCETAGTLNITRVSTTHAVVTAGGSRAVMELTTNGPVISNDEYAVYGIDNVLSPCCLNLDFTSLNLTSILNQPELRAYIKGLNLTSPIIGKIMGFLNFALKYIKENGEQLNKTPVTVVLPYPAVIAAALEQFPEEMKNESTYAAVFLNHIIPQPVTYDTISAAGGSQTVQTMLDIQYGPFKCDKSGVVVSVSSTADNYTQLMPVFGTASTDTGYSMCSGSQVYFSEALIMPCNLNDAISSVDQNLTADVKKSQAATGSDSTGTGSGQSANAGTAPSTTTSNGTTARAASPAVVLSPRQWVSSVLVAVSMLLVLLL